MTKVVILKPDAIIKIWVPEYHSGQAIGYGTILSSAAAKELNDYLESGDKKIMSEWNMDFGDSR